MGKLRFPGFGKAVLLAALLAVAPLASAQSEDIPVRPRSEPIDPELSMRTAPTGTIVVRLALASGASIPFLAEVKLFSHMGFQQTSGFTKSDAQVVFRNVPVGEYNVEVKADGYANVQDQAILWTPGAIAVVYVNLRPVGSGDTLPGPAGFPVLAPKARKHMEKGLQELRRGNLKQSLNELEKGLKLAPSHPYLNFLIGMVHLRMNHFAEARQLLEKSVRLGPSFGPAQEALGVVRMAQEDYAGAIPSLEQALAISPDRWELHWRIGMACFQTQQLQKALAYAERAKELAGPAAAEPKVLLGFTLARLGQRERALKELEEFLAANPDAQETPRVRLAVQKLREESAAASTLQDLPGLLPATRAGNLSLEIENPDRPWAPPGVDDSVPPVRPNATCSLPDVLRDAGRRVLLLAQNLESIGATETIVHAELDPQGFEKSSGSVTFRYLVTIREPRKGHLSVEEMREGGTVGVSPRMFTTGLAAMALAFHPYYVDDFEMKCEGLGQWQGQPAWQVHFQQRMDRPSRLVIYKSEHGVFAVSQKGRVWIAANSHEILRMETDLISPMKEIHLARQHMAIEYAPVPFHDRKLQLWLPASAVLHIQARGRRLRHQHVFRDFVLFSVETRQKIESPVPPRN